MGANTLIAWCEHTFNAWEGCFKTSPACANCYAEARDKRIHGGRHWGPQALRTVHAPSYWRAPLKWHREAAAAGRVDRVFAHSLSDVAEDRRDLDAPRAWLSELIRVTADIGTPTEWAPGYTVRKLGNGLRWMLLTKHPQNLARLFPEDVLERCMVGATVEGPEQLWRLNALRDTPAHRRFVSAEPLLKPLELGPALGWIDLVIVGGESGKRARPFDLAWARALRDETRAAERAFFLKQLGARPFESAPIRHFEAWSEEAKKAYPNGAAELRVALQLADDHGGDPDEWSEDLRIREWP